MTHALAFYAGVACATFVLVRGSLKNRLLSALLWPTFPLWLLRP